MQKSGDLATFKTYVDEGIQLKKEGSIDNYQKAIALQLKQPPWVYQSLGDALNPNRSVDEAISAYQKAIEIKPDHPYFYLSLAKLYFQKGDLDSVITNYRKAISLKQDQPLPLWVYKSLGEAPRLQGRGDEATTSFKSTFHIKEKKLRG